MTDDELRVLVRDAIVRHLGPGPGSGSGGQAVHRAHDARPVPAPAGPTHDARPVPAWRAHPSFGKFLVIRGDQDGGRCLIEPAVECNHCGFCQSYGH